MSKFAARLEALAKGQVKAKIARAIHKDPSTFSNYVSGKREPDLETINALCRYFNVSADYLMGRSDDRGSYGASLAEASKTANKPRASDGVPVAATREDGNGGAFYVIPRVARQVGAGASIDDLEHPSEAPEYMFRRQFLQYLSGGKNATIDPQRWSIAHVAKGEAGSSMMPTILPRAMLLIDRNENAAGWDKPEPRAIYLINDGDGLVVKRARVDEQGYLVLISDNALEHPPRLIPLRGRDLRTILVGRVRLVSQEV